MGFYGHPETHLWGDSWKLLSYLNNQFSLPWFCCGDFNEILFVNEKVGGSQRSQQQNGGLSLGSEPMWFPGPWLLWSGLYLVQHARRHKQNFPST